jgi:hypothetical protein
MYIPQFPYKSKQLILSSNRVHLLAKSDSVILSGDKSVIISSPGPIHVNSNESIFLDADIVELGHEAQDLGEPVILGRRFIHRLSVYLSSLKNCGESLETIGEELSAITGMLSISSRMKDAGQLLKNSSDSLESYIKLNEELGSRVLSNTTYTR